MSAAVIALSTLKGGVGKTTLSVNLSAGLALRNKRVLLVDLDPQAHATASVGSNTPASIAYCYLNFPETTRSEIVQTTIPTVDLLPASAKLRDVNRAIASRNFVHRLAEILQPVQDDYDFIIIDCPLLESLLENALIAADWLLMPVVPQYLSISGVQQMLGLTNQLQQDVGQCAQLLGLVLSQVDRRVRLTQENIDILRSHYKERLFDTEIPVNSSLAEAPEFGESIFQYAPRSRGALAFGQLSKEVLRRLS